MSKAMIYIDGVLREMTPEDERYFPEIEMPAPEPTPEERMNEIEAALIELASMLAGGMKE